MSAIERVNDLVRLITSSCKLSTSEALPIAASLVRNGLDQKEKIAEKTVEELQVICPTVLPIRVTALHKACKRKRSTVASRGSRSGDSRASKRGIGQALFKDPEDVRTDDSSTCLPIAPDNSKETDSGLEASMPVITINRAPVMILFAYVVCAHVYPEYGSSSHLSLASGAASAASQRKGASLGIPGMTSTPEETSKQWEGFRTRRVLGSIEVPVIKRGDKEDGYWAVDTKRSENEDGQFKWIHPLSVRNYLVRAFGGELILGQVHRAVEQVAMSWEDKDNLEELFTRGWSWYVGCRPEVSSSREGWGQKGTLSCSKILQFRRSTE
ncbi:uncharacterized protein V1516DRAFT_619229 [Lipomyces oligophaga]|uniref:uncharacterized protein n=1 Tax=Lipomyces oligophaga TaxID=45792 RepID=UPI0034CDA33D